MYSFISAITSINARDISKGACDISRTSRDLKAIFVRLVKLKVKNTYLFDYCLSKPFWGFLPYDKGS